MRIIIKVLDAKIVKYIFLSFLAILLDACSNRPLKNVPPIISKQELARNFKTPPQDVKPWVYWYWINNHISKDGITKDLESMARIGIGAALIGNIYLDNIAFDGKVTMLSPEWLELTQHAIREGGRLGVDIGLFNSPGWSQSGGPWNDSSNAMRYLTSSEIQISGPKKISEKLTLPVKSYQDVAVLAFPSTQESSSGVSTFQVSAEGLLQPNLLVDRDTDTMVSFEDAKELEILLESQNAVTVRSLKLYPSKSTFIMDCKLLAEVEGKWEEVRSFKFDRSNDMDQVGFMTYPPVVVSFPEVKAANFKILCTQIMPTRKSEHIGLSEIDLSPKANLEYYVEKSLGKMHQTPLPLGDAYRWPAQLEPKDKEWVVDHDKIIDLSDKMSADGTLTWEVPEGTWTIQRMAMTPTGVKNHPAAPNARGLEVDKINRNALNRHFESFIGVILNAMPPEDRQAFKYVVADSYETGGQNWTDDFDISFEEKYGYNPRKWLPVLSGQIVGSVEKSNRFLWDLRRLVADKVAYEYVGGLKSLCAENDLQLWLENYGHWGFPSEFLMYGGQSDLIGGEFWVEGSLGSIECKAASSAAHIYGKKQVFAESFTAAGKPFLRYPGMLKKRGDWSFTEGINQVLLHVYIEQPYEEKYPGVNAWFGTEFNRKNTWFDKSKPWIDYERRCQYMLQQGLYVADVAYFIGEDTPKMTGVASPELPEGYSFDYMNAEVIAQRLSIENGKFTLPDGMTYRILVLPDSETIRPEVLEKIKDLVADGGVIMGNPPIKSPSLENYPEVDQRITALAKELWGEDLGESNKVTSFGKGKVIHRMELSKAFEMLGIEPDFKINAGFPVLWTHRHLENEEVYFLTNQSEHIISFDASFRVNGMQPEFWDAVTGDSRKLPEFYEEGSYTRIPMKLAPQQSGFLVFSADGRREGKSQKMDNFPAGRELMVMNQDWEIHFDNPALDLDKTVVIKALKDWAAFEDEDIRYYSGSATYKTHFKLDAIPNNSKTYIDIGNVSVMAEITLNGKKVGGLWTSPWRLEVTDLLKNGENELEIEVTNLWANQLIRDSKLPKEARKTWTLTPTAYEADNALQPSGLMGPVRFMMVNEM